MSNSPLATSCAEDDFCIMKSTTRVDYPLELNDFKKETIKPKVLYMLKSKKEK